MSRIALALAVRNQLRASVVTGGLALQADSCELGDPEGRPPPLTGDRYVSVWCGSRRGQRRGQQCIDEYYSMHVGVTQRINGTYPIDRWVEIYTAFDYLVDKIRVCIAADQLDWRVINRASAILLTGVGWPIPVPDINTLGFTEPMYFAGDDTPRKVDADWWHAEPTGQPCGLFTTLKFEGARRLQRFGTTDMVT